MIPTEIAELTPDWFTGVLRGAQIIREASGVSAVDAEPIGTGQVSCVLRAQPTYNGEPGPASVVVKVPSKNAGSRQMAVGLRNWRGGRRGWEPMGRSLTVVLTSDVLVAHPREGRDQRPPQMPRAQPERALAP